MKFFSILKNNKSNLIAPAIWIAVHAMIIGDIVNNNRKTKIYEKKWQDAGYQKMEIGKVDKVAYVPLSGVTYTEKHSIYAWKKPSDTEQQPYDNYRKNAPYKLKT